MIITEAEKKKFCKMVEDRAQDTKMSYIDIVLECCEKFGIEPEVAGKFLNAPLREKLYVEFQSVNLLPKTKSKLPI